MRFDDQVAVITGAGGGLGKQYALLLASRGARVVGQRHRRLGDGSGPSTDAATTAVEEIRQHGGEAIADTHSVTSPEGGQAIIDTALHAWGRVDIVINNAGIVRDAPFEDITADRLDPLVDVHLQGRVPRDQTRVEGDARAALRTNPQHLLGRRDSLAPSG